MAFCISLRLYGQPEAIQTARSMLENLPQVRRMDCLQDPAQIELLLSTPLYENSLIPLLSQSGISGFRLL